MRLLFWNARGCNKLFKQKEIRQLLLSNKVDIAILLETRVKQEKAQKIIEKISKGWDSITNYYVVVNGRIWCMWNPRKVLVRKVEEHEQAILCEVFDVLSGTSQHVLAIYALNTHDQRKAL